MNFKKLPIVAVTSALMAAPTLAIAEEELEFDEAQLYFELNDSDGDLGIHGKVDGGPWKKVKIEGPNDRTLLRIRARSRLARQGMTELFFESAEPTFDELHPDDFFDRFPEGEYEWEGVTTNYQEIEGEVFLSHIMPEAPVVVSVGCDPLLPKCANEGFDDEGDKICWKGADTDGGVLIEWEPVDESHWDKWSNGETPLPGETKIPLGASADDAGVVVADRVIYYEFVAEIDDTEYKTTALIPPGVTEWTIPEEFIDLIEDFELKDEEGEDIEEVKFEIIVRVESGEGEDDDDEEVDSRPGNQSAVEDCFEI